MIKSFFYLIIVLASVFYALPVIPFHNQDILAKVFSIFWITFALLLIGAHLNILIDLDAKGKKDFNKLEEYWNWEKEQKLLQSHARYYKKMK